MEAATSGIGKATCEALVSHNPAQIFILSRNMDKGAMIIGKIQAASPNNLMTFIPCDLSSFISIRKAVSDFAVLSSCLDLLICNSSICMVSPGLTADGYEMQFGVSHLGHALLVKLLLPSLLRTTRQPPEDVRIVLLTSSEHDWAPKECITFNGLQTTQENLTCKQRYGQSKLASIIYAREMARWYPAIKTVAVSPGNVDTSIMYHWRRKYLRVDRLIRLTTTLLNKLYRRIGREAFTPEEGTRTSMWAATAPTAGVANGAYYVRPGVVGQTSEAARDVGLGSEIWAWTQRIVGAVPYDERHVMEWC
jgi:NAD(P)-dependent dehydrogenase (short-subunit alcohol dehydrogenase family)